MAVPAVWRLVYYLLVSFPFGAMDRAKAHRRCLSIGETRCAPLLKSKSKLLLVSPIGIE